MQRRFTLVTFTLLICGVLFRAETGRAEPGAVPWAGARESEPVRVQSERVSQERARGSGPGHLRPAERRKAMAGRRYAVVIGIDVYHDPAFQPLHYAGADARALRTALKVAGFDDVRLVVDASETTRTELKEILESFSRALKPEDTLLVFFSGHGALDVDAKDNPALYLVPSDASLDALATSAISVLDMLSWMGMSRRRSDQTALQDVKAPVARRRALILDNCFNGRERSKSAISASARAVLPRLQDVLRRLDHILNNVDALVMATTTGGVAWERDDLGHGVFSYYLLEALSRPLERDANGDGALSLGEVFDYVRQKTSQATMGEQLPEALLRLVGDDDVYLFGEPDPVLADAHARIFAYKGDYSKGWSLEVAGKRSTFPGTALVPAGEHQVVVRNEQGQVKTEGRLRFAGGEIYPLRELEAELGGYRSFFGLRTGLSWAVIEGASVEEGLSPAAEGLWGLALPTVMLQAGYRIRGGHLRGATLALEGGLGAGLDGRWKAECTACRDWDWRPVVELGVITMVRRSWHRLELGGGGRVGMRYAVPMVDPSLKEPGTGVAPWDGWLTFPASVVGWQGYPLRSKLRLTLQQELTLTMLPAVVERSGENGGWAARRLELYKVPAFSAGVSFGLEFGG